MIIVGAGIIGLSCAWALLRKGIPVSILDARTAASEASWAGAGMLAPGGEFDRPAALTMFGIESLRQYPEFVRELEEESGVSIDYRRSGAIEVALNDAEAEDLTRRSEAQAQFGIRSEACVHEGWPARYYPDDAIVDPRDVTAALIVALERRGIIIRQGDPVRSISRTGCAIRTARGEERGDGVLISAGAWSWDLFPGLPRTMPVRGHLISWSLEPGRLEPILRHGHTYLLQRRSGVLIAGSTTEHAGFDRQIDESAVADIQARASVLLPSLASRAPDEKWNGFRPGIAAEEPAVGQLPGLNIWTAFGHYRNGILLAPETARRIAQSAG